MQQEKIAIIALVIIVAAAVVGFLFFRYSGELFPKPEPSIEGGTIDEGDCAQVHYIGKYASNETVFDSSYEDEDAKTGGKPLKVFVSLNRSKSPPEGYSNYSSGLIEGFMDGLIGLEQGETFTIGPIPPEKGYGVKPEEGDVISLSEEEVGQEFTLEFYKILINASVELVPEQLRQGIQGNRTDVYVLRDKSYEVGDKITLYPSWPNATVVTKINETNIWYETRPSEEEMTDFTWIESNPYLGNVQYWANSSSAVIDKEQNNITITHSPDVGQTMSYPTGQQRIDYTVVDLTEDKVNCSYTNPSTGNVSYRQFDRVKNVKYNETQSITFSYPENYMSQILNMFKQYSSNLNYSLDPLAGETLEYEVKIVKVFNTGSQ